MVQSKLLERYVIEHIFCPLEVLSCAVANHNLNWVTLLFRLVQFEPYASSVNLIMLTP